VTPPAEAAEPHFATDIITFYHPAFWGLETPDKVRELALADAGAFWARILDALALAGVTGVELTFAPGDIESALRAFGSASSFRRALEERGLRVVSAFVASRIRSFAVR
jgi:inosose dehydratase